MHLFLYVDEDSVAACLIAALRRGGIDVLSALELGRLGLTDEDQLHFATEQQRPILTRNYVDFARIHKRWAVAGIEHNGILI